MKKYVISSLSIILVIMTVFLVSGCSDSTSDPVTPAATTGSMFITSVPAGAQIWVNGSNTNKVTPDSVVNLSPATYNVTLKLTNYTDATFQVAVVAGVQAKPSAYSMVSDLSTVAYGPIRIYEFNATQPSGLNYRNGTRAFSMSGTDKDSVDLYYATDGYDIQSPYLQSTSLRKTYLIQPSPSASNLLDGADSPSFVLANWGNAITHENDSTTYYFSYDNDHHYSKIKIVGYGGGTTGNPAWVEIKWVYNKKVDDPRF